MVPVLKHSPTIGNLMVQPNQFAAGWHGVSDIQTMMGLPGTYAWYENPLTPAVIRFMFSPTGGGYRGTYDLRVGATVVEASNFYTAPNNPASGYGLVVLRPGEAMERGFAVLGMLTDSNWRILSMLLGRFNPGGSTIVSTFWAIRIA